MRVILALTVLLALLAVSFVSAESRRGPVTRPIIENPLVGKAKKAALKRVADIIGTEPSAAKLEAQVTVEDEWNGEEGYGKAMRIKQVKKELKNLNNLIKQAKAIVKVLPAKQQRVKELKTELLKLRGISAEEAARQKIKVQQAILDDIQSKESAMNKKVAALKQSEGRLLASIERVKKMAKGHAGTLPRFAQMEQELNTPEF